MQSRSDTRLMQLCMCPLTAPRQHLLWRPILPTKCKLILGLESRSSDICSNEFLYVPTHPGAGALQVPCVAVVENMAYFDGAGQRFFPFGEGSGARICSEFGLPNLTRMPIIPELSAAGDGAAQEQDRLNLQRLQGFSETWVPSVKILFGHPHPVDAAVYLMRVLCGCLCYRIRLHIGATLHAGARCLTYMLVDVCMPAWRQRCSAPASGREACSTHKPGHPPSCLQEMRTRCTTCIGIGLTQSATATT